MLPDWCVFADLETEPNKNITDIIVIERQTTKRQTRTGRELGEKISFEEDLW